MARNAVADPDLQIRGEGGGEGGHPDPEIREGVWPQGTAKYDIISTYVLPQKLMRFLLQKGLTSTLYTIRININ